jgi:hypothetical protein
MPGPGKAVYGSVYLYVYRVILISNNTHYYFKKVFNFIFSKYLASYFSKTIYNILIGVGPKGYYGYDALIRTQYYYYLQRPVNSSSNYKCYRSTKGTNIFMV